MVSLITLFDDTILFLILLQTINGVDVRDINPQWLRQHIVPVNQVALNRLRYNRDISLGANTV